MENLEQLTKELQMTVSEIHRIAYDETSDKILKNFAMTLSDIAYCIRMYVIEMM